MNADRREIGKWPKWLAKQIFRLKQMQILIAIALSAVSAMSLVTLAFGGIVATYVAVAGAILLVMLAVWFHKVGLWTALRNWEYGSSDNYAWDRRNLLASARIAKMMKMSIEELDAIIEEERNWLLGQYTGQDPKGRESHD